jgi:uncharacterized ion transporter superfamily protein YfcC
LISIRGENMMTDAELAREVTGFIDEAIRKNRRIESFLLVLLVGLSASGIALMIYGAISERWFAATLGAACFLVIGLLLRSLIRLREEDVRLALLPSMVRLANSPGEKRSVTKFVEALIGRIGA